MQKSQVLAVDAEVVRPAVVCEYRTHGVPLLKRGVFNKDVETNIVSRRDSPPKLSAS